MKNKKTIFLLLFIFIATATLASITYAADSAMNPIVRVATNMGTIEIELDPIHAPVTVQNFIHYTRSGFYNGTIFHRVIPGFMIQGGGFVSGMEQKPTGAPIKNEANNGLKNLTGTVAMARTGDPASATAQFFINLKDNSFLNYTAPTKQGWGYCVFGRVIKGMDVVKRIETVPTKNIGGFQDVPETTVVIEKVELLNNEANVEAEAQEETRFENVAKDYHNAVTKPTLLEEAHKYKVQAEGAVRDKQFADAAQLYGKALDIAPWWPEGHFNRAIVLAETKYYLGAIREMKRYLTLVPDAPDARAAQDKIYDWERKAGK